MIWSARLFTFFCGPPEAVHVQETLAPVQTLFAKDTSQTSKLMLVPPQTSFEACIQALWKAAHHAFSRSGCCLFSRFVKGEALTTLWWLLPRTASDPRVTRNMMVRTDFMVDWKSGEEGVRMGVLLKVDKADKMC